MVVLQSEYQTVFEKIVNGLVEQGVEPGFAEIRANLELGPSPQAIFNAYARTLEENGGTDKETIEVIHYPQIKESDKWS